jgi:hypothetical protein
VVDCRNTIFVFLTCQNLNGYGFAGFFRRTSSIKEKKASLSSADRFEKMLPLDDGEGTAREEPAEEYAGGGLADRVGGVGAGGRNGLGACGERAGAEDVEGVVGDCPELYCIDFRSLYLEPQC